MSEKQQGAELADTAAMQTRHKRGTNRRVPLRVCVIATVLIAVWIVCVRLDRKPADVAAPPGPPRIPTVVVQTVKSGPASPPLEFTGHVEALQTVDLRAEVAGRIDTVHFKEGAPVKAGDLLFTIRQAPFRAQVNAARASLAQAEADLVRAEKLLNRMTSADPRSVVQTDLDSAESAALQGRAAVQQAQAGLELAEIDLEYTEIRAPIGGKIGKAFFTKGNYVSPATGTLAQLVQQDPVRVVYSLSDRDYLRQSKAARQNQPASVEFRLKLPDGTIYSRAGTRDFVNNQMDAGTATIALWDEYANPDGVLIPGTYVVVQIIGQATGSATLIPQEAVLSDDLGYFTYTVNGEGVVEEKRLNLGGTIDDHFSVRAGLDPGDRVVVKGIQRIECAGQQVRAVDLPQTEGN